MTWMRQKNEPGPAKSPSSSTKSSYTPSSPKAPEAKPQASMPNPAPSTPIVNVGESVQIKGELTGNEDLVIEGRIEGHIRLPQHTLTIGASARIHAEVSAKTVNVLGEVTGNIVAGVVDDTV